MWFHKTKAWTKCQWVHPLTQRHVGSVPTFTGTHTVRSRSLLLHLSPRWLFPCVLRPADTCLSVWLAGILCVGLFVPDKQRGFYESHQRDFLLLYLISLGLLLGDCAPQIESKVNGTWQIPLWIHKHKSDETGNDHPRPPSVFKCVSASRP